MSQQPWTVCFAGPGLVTEADVKAQLDNWWKDEPEETDFTLVLPDRITRTQKGLGNVAAYVTASFGNDEQGDDGFVTVPIGNMVAKLVDAQDSGHEVHLVLLYGKEGDDACRNLLEAAIEAGISVKDLTAGLDNLKWEEEEPEVPPDAPETKPKGRTGRTRHPSTPPAEKPAEAVTEPPRTKPPSRTRGKPRAAAQEPNEGNDPTSSVNFAFQEMSLTPETISEIVYVEMKASWIRILTVMLEALKSDGRKPGRPRTKFEEDEKHAFWTDGDGNYTKRGRGKPPRGQEVVWLTNKQVEEMGLLEESE